VVGAGDGSGGDGGQIGADVNSKPESVYRVNASRLSNTPAH